MHQGKRAKIETKRTVYCTLITLRSDGKKTEDRVQQDRERVPETPTRKFRGPFTHCEASCFGSWQMCASLPRCAGVTRRHRRRRLHQQFRRMGPLTTAWVSLRSMSMLLPRLAQAEMVSTVRPYCQRHPRPRQSATHRARLEALYCARYDLREVHAVAEGGRRLRVRDGP